MPDFSQLSITQKGSPLPGTFIKTLNTILIGLEPKASYALISNVEKINGFVGIRIERVCERSISFLYKESGTLGWKCLLSWGDGNFSGEQLEKRMKGIFSRPAIAALVPASKPKSLPQVLKEENMAQMACPAVEESLVQEIEPLAVPDVKRAPAPKLRSVLAGQQATAFFFARVLELYPNGLVTLPQVSAILIGEFGYTSKGAKSTWHYLAKKCRKRVQKDGSGWAISAKEDPCDVIEKQMERLRQLAFFAREEGRGKLCEEILKNSKACKEAFKELRRLSKNTVRP